MLIDCLIHLKAAENSTKPRSSCTQRLHVQCTQVKAVLQKKGRIKSKNERDNVGNRKSFYYIYHSLSQRFIRFSTATQINLSPSISILFS